MSNVPFIPMGSGIAIAATAASAATALPAVDAMYARIANIGTGIAHVKLGASDAAAAVTDTAISPGDDLIVVVGRGTGIDYVATRTPSGSTTLQVSKGEIVKA